MKYLYFKNTNAYFLYRTDIQYYLCKRTLWEPQRSVLGQGDSYSTDDIYKMHTNLHANALCGEAVVQEMMAKVFLELFRSYTEHVAPQSGLKILVKLHLFCSQLVQSICDIFRVPCCRPLFGPAHSENAAEGSHG